MPMRNETQHVDGDPELGKFALDLELLEQAAMRTRLMQGSPSVSDADAAEQFAWFSTGCMLLISKTDDLAIVSRVVGFFTEVHNFSKEKRVAFWQEVHDLGQAARKAAGQ